MYLLVLVSLKHPLSGVKKTHMYKKALKIPNPNLHVQILLVASQTSRYRSNGGKNTGNWQATAALMASEAVQAYSVRNGVPHPAEHYIMSI